MVPQSSYITEFLAETNLVLSQEDYGNHFYDLLSPLRSFLHADEELLSFSLARYCGATSHVAFFCEWYVQYQQLLRDIGPLFDKNKEYLEKKVPLKLKGVPNLKNIISRDINQVFIPHQMAILNTKTNELRSDITKTNPFLSKYVSVQYLSKFITSDLVSIKQIYSVQFALKSYIDAQMYRTSFIMIGLPCLLGFLYNFNQPDSPINPEGVRWVVLEELMCQIALLHQTNQQGDLQRMVYSSRLSDKEEFNWFQLSPEKQLQQAIASTEAREMTQEIRAKVYKRGGDLLESMVFPDRYKQMLRELLSWAYDT